MGFELFRGLGFKFRLLGLGLGFKFRGLGFRRPEVGVQLGLDAVLLPAVLLYCILMKLLCS